MLFHFTPLSKLPSSRGWGGGSLEGGGGVGDKHNYCGGFVLINCQILRTDGKENSAAVRKENNMLELGTESSQ